MAGGFQPNAFQHNAFQTEGAVEVADDRPGNVCMSGDVDMWAWDAYENYQDDIQGTQSEPQDDDAEVTTIVNKAFPDPNFDFDLYEPGEFWFATGPPTSLDDETGETRGQTCLPDYLEPDDQLDPSDADWQNPTTQNDALCTFPAYVAGARTETVSGTTHTITLPTYVAGDGVLLLSATSSTAILTAPAGWTQLYSINSSTTPVVNIGAFWRVMDGAEGATVDITTSNAETMTVQALSFRQIDPYTAPDFSTDTSAGAADDPPSLTHDFPDQKVMWVAVDYIPDNSHSITNAPINYRTWGLIGALSGDEQYVLVGMRQLEAQTADPSAFVGSSTTSATATLAIKGYCADNINDDPARSSIPDDLEPEAEVDCYGWQSQGPTDDPSSIVVDDLLTVTAIPDYLEPEAEPNPDDIGSGGWSAGATDDGIICYFPVVESTATDNDIPPDTSHSVTMPSGVVSGDKLIIFFFTEDNCTKTPPTGWTRISTSSTTEGAVFAKVSDGTEGATETVTTSASTRAAAITYRISTQFEGGDWYAIAEEFTDNSSNPTLAPGWADNPTLWLSAILDYGAANDKTAPPSGFSNQLTATTGFGRQGDTAQRTFGAFTLSPGDWSPNNNAGTYFTVAIRGVCVGERYETGSQWTAVTEPPEDVFEESPEWLRTPTFEFDGDNEPAPRCLPDDMELEDEPLQDGWQQSVTIEDFPLDPELNKAAIPDDLEPEAEVDSDGWRASPLHDFPDNADINNRAVPDELEPEAEPLQDGWQVAPLHDTPSTADITGTAVPDALEPEAEVDTDGWAFRLPDMEAPPAAPASDPGVSVGTLPGVRPRRKWWVENISAEEKRRKRIHGTRWPDLPDVDVPKRWQPRVITDKMVRPRLDAAQRDWKTKIRKSRQRDDEIIMAIIAVLMAEDADEK